MRPNRRTLLAAAGALTAIAASARASKAEPSLILFDPAEPGARAFAKSRGGKAVAITGDRIRLARRLLGKGAPKRLTVIGRHADVLLLTEAAQEHGYRAERLNLFPTLDGGLFVWTARRRA